MPEKVIVKEVEDGIEGAPPWITTFVDMVSLLVTFFILLFTFSSIREYDSFTIPKNLIGTKGMQDTKGSHMEAPTDDLMLAMDLARGSRTRHNRPVDQLSESLDAMGQKMTEDHMPIDLRTVGDGIRIEFDAKGSFAPGSAKIEPFLERALAELGKTVQHYPLVVLIEGHTDDAFRPSNRYPTESAMAIARARAAAEVVTGRGGLDPAMVQISAVGSSLPRAMEKDSAVARKMNRRVTVRLVAMGKERASYHEKLLRK
ncbi:MAG: OmpA family protein [Planctomycetota bacterium]